MSAGWRPGRGALQAELDRLRRRLLAGHGVVFLGLDVLAPGTNKTTTLRLDARCVGLLDALCGRLDAVAVPVTPWGVTHTAGELEARLRDVGFSNLVLDVVPLLGRKTPWAHLVARWCAGYPDVTRWVVLDTSPQALHPARSVVVDAATGLTRATFLEAARVLGGAPASEETLAVLCAPTTCLTCGRDLPSQATAHTLGSLVFCPSNECVARYRAARAEESLPWKRCP